MKEFKGTHGEWNYNHARGEVVSKSEGLIAELVVNGREDNNGSLIAAAPDLLEALRMLEVSVNNIRYCWEKRPENMWKAIQQAENDCESARAAISKALGED
ncbi:hypothetical protein ACENXD_001881 [Enterobacter bugandensis]